MRILAFSLLLLVSALAAFSQDAPPASEKGLTEKAPPAVDEALRARVNKFYDDFVAGKYKDAYLMVADDSQDKFFELSKDQYKGCEIIKINYTENFTKATVVTSCKRDWRFHGSQTTITFPLTSTWKVIDGQWFWHFVKPTMIATPFSPTGFIPASPDNTGPNAALAAPDIATAAQNILAKVGIDKSAVRLESNQHSFEVIHLRNDMPGEITVTVDQPQVPGLKVGLGQAKLQAHEQTTISFEWLPPQPGTRVNTKVTVRVHIDPTAQVFPIDVAIEAPSVSAVPTSTAPQK